MQEMRFGFSGEAFGNLLVLIAILFGIYMFLVYFIARKRGIDITTNRFQIKVLIVGTTIFFLIPWWLSDLTIKWKIIGMILVYLVFVGDYIAIDRGQRMLKKMIKGKKKGK